MKNTRHALRHAALCLTFITMAITVPAPAAADTAPDLLLVFDASGSMWGQIDGENKIVIARRVLREVLTGLPDGARVGLLAYGHRRDGDCGDIEMLAPLGSSGPAGVVTAVDGLNPKGKTPITASVEQAFAALEARGADAGPATVLLISDGLETCGGDPCAAVRKAAEGGLDFRLHVVGFGIEEGDVSQLECAAQAGNGLYLAAADAEQLSSALGRAVEVVATAEPPATLAVAAIRNGEPVDAMVTVIPVGGDARTTPVAGGRTYTGPETNPRRLPVPPGTYDVTVRALRLQGEPVVRFPAVEVPGGELVEKRADFTSGELAVRITRNGALSDAMVEVTRPGEKRGVAGGRTYTGENSNPRVFELTPGEYVVTAKSLEIGGGPAHDFGPVTITAGRRAELGHEWPSGVLRVGVFDGEQGVDAGVDVKRDGKPVAAGRTYDKGTREFVLEPGDYTVTVRPIRHADKASRELRVTVRAGEETEEMVRLGGG